MSSLIANGDIFILQHLQSWVFNYIVVSQFAFIVVTVIIQSLRCNRVTVS